MQIRRALTLAVAVGLGVTLSAQNVLKEEKKQSKQEQQDAQTLVALLDSAVSGRPVGMDVPAKVTLSPNKDTVVSVSPEGTAGEVAIKFEGAHFIRGQDGKTYVPFTVQVDPKQLSSPSAAMFVRAVDKRQAETPKATSGERTEKKDDQDKDDKNRQEYAWESVHFVNVPQDGLVARAMMLPGGEYDLYFAIKDKNTGDKKQVAKAGLLRKTLSVPDYSGNEFTTSSIILAQSIEPVPTEVTVEQQQEHPYTFGNTRVVPSRDGKLKKSGQLDVVFYIYGSTPDANKKPDVQLDCNFYQKTAEGEKYFNKTAPQMVNASTLPPNFDLAAGHQLPGMVGVPLASFAPGDYRLEIKVTDKPSGKALTREVFFSVVE
jgi:hypothetical protein